VIAPLKGCDFDLFIETDGGETDPTEAIVSYLRSASCSFRAIVPLRAKSNGTLICLAANEILMGPTSELGPIEPSVNFVPASILRHERYKEKNVKLSIEGDFAYQQTRALAERLLTEGMMKNSNDEARTRTINALCTRDYYASHGSVINQAEAKDLGLSVTSLSSDDELWKKLFLLHCFYSYDSEARGVSKYFEQETYSATVVGDDPPIDLGDH
jgi:membrane-bound ClpP family serine protease